MSEKHQIAGQLDFFTESTPDVVVPVIDGNSIAKAASFIAREDLEELPGKGIGRLNPADQPLSSRDISRIAETQLPEDVGLASMHITDARAAIEIAQTKAKSGQLRI